MHGATATGDLLTVSLDNPDAENPALVAALVAAGAAVRYVSPQTHTLEEIYLQLLGQARESRQLVGAER